MTMPASLGRAAPLLLLAIVCCVPSAERPAEVSRRRVLPLTAASHFREDVLTIEGQANTRWARLQGEWTPAIETSSSLEILLALDDLEGATVQSGYAVTGRTEGGEQPAMLLRVTAASDAEAPEQSRILFEETVPAEKPRGGVHHLEVVVPSTMRGPGRIGLEISLAEPGGGSTGMLLDPEVSVPARPAVATARDPWNVLLITADRESSRLPSGAIGCTVSPIITCNA